MKMHRASRDKLPHLTPASRNGFLWVEMLLNGPDVSMLLVRSSPLLAGAAPVSRLDATLVLGAVLLL